MPHTGPRQHGDPNDQPRDPQATTRYRGAHDNAPPQPPPMERDVPPPRWHGTHPPQNATTRAGDRTSAKPSNAHGAHSDARHALVEGIQRSGIADEHGAMPAIARQTNDSRGEAGIDSPVNPVDAGTGDHLADGPQNTAGQNSHAQPRHHGRSTDHAIDRSEQTADASGAADSSDVHTLEPRADDPAGSEASVREIARTVRSALIGTDLLRSGPVLWPFGHRARRRRAHNQRVAEEAARRRAQLRETFDATISGTTTTHTNDNHRVDVTDTEDSEDSAALRGDRARRPVAVGRQPVDRRTRAFVVTCLTGLVLAVVVAMVWLGDPEARQDASRIPDDPTVASTSTATSDSTSSPPSTAGPSLAPLPPIPPSGVAPIPGRPSVPVDPRSVLLVDPPTTAPTRAELSTPDAAMRAWLARWCPFDYTDPFGTAERRTQPAMTEAGWATLNPDNNTPAADRVRASWEQTIAARESGRCAHPEAAISPQAPRSDTTAIVIGTVTRVITTDTAGDTAGGNGGPQAYVEQVSEARIVRRGPDGLWRVDLATAGG